MAQHKRPDFSSGAWEIYLAEATSVWRDQRYAAESIADGAPSTLALGYWMVLAVLTATLAAAAWRIRRQHLTRR